MTASRLLAPLFLLALLVPVAGAQASVVPLGPHGTGLKQRTDTVIDPTTGTTYLAWTTNDGVDDRAVFRTIDATGDLGATRTVSGAGVAIGGTQIAVASDGTVHQVWIENGTDLQYRATRPDGTMTATQLVSVGSGGLGAAQVLVDATGAVHVVWVETTTNPQLFHVRIAPNGTMGVPDPITDGTTTVGKFDAALGSDGTLHLAWDNASVLEYTTISSGGTVAPTIQPDPAEDVDGERVVVDSVGTARIVYLATYPADSRLKAIDITSGGVAGAAQFLSVLGHAVNAFDIALAQGNDVLVAWDDNDTVGSFQTTYMRIANDGTPGPVIPVDLVDSQAHDVRLAATPSGGATYVVERSSGVVNRIYYYTISSADSVSSSIVVSGNANASSFSEVAVDSQGRSFVTWAEDTVGQRLWVVGSLAYASGSSLDLGTREVGAGTSAASTVTIRNRDAASLDAQLGTPALSGTGASSFAIASTTCGATLAPNASCTVNVTFTPTAAGSFAATLTIPQASPGRAMTVALTGTGTPAPVVDESVTCPAGNSTGVRCFRINDSIRAAWGCAPGQEDGYLILGTAGGDIIRGTGRGDIVLAGAGGDTVRSGAGNDAIWGAGGMDGIYSDAGDDCVNAGALADQVWGGAGADIIHGNSGGDTIRGGTGNDRVYGDDNRDTLYGNAGNDVLFGGRHPDKLYGSAGNDRLFGGPGDDPVLDGGAGRNTITA